MYGRQDHFSRSIPRKVTDNLNSISLFTVRILYAERLTQFGMKITMNKAHYIIHQVGPNWRIRMRGCVENVIFKVNLFEKLAGYIR